MGKKIDALLGRSFKTSKFKALANLSISRLAVLKNQRQARLSVARTDIVQLLNLGHHERALLRVEQVIKEQNMLDVFVIIEGYCFLLIERVSLIEQEKICPDELKEAISSLIYAATRCGEFPELQEIRAVLTTRFGKEFASRAIELRNNCGVNLKMIQKLSTRTPSLESRLNALKEIASENGIVLQIEEASSVTTEEKLDTDQMQNPPKPDTSAIPGGGAKDGNNLTVLPEDTERFESFSDSITPKKKYRDVADAAQAAFESAAYAAAAARAAVELSRSESHDPDDQNSPSPRSRKVHDTREPMKSGPNTSEEKDSSATDDMNVGFGFEKIHPIQNYHSESEDEEVPIENKAIESKQSKDAAEFKRSLSTSSSDSADDILKGTALSSEIKNQTDPLRMEIVFDDSDDETANMQSEIPLSRTHDLGFDMKQSLLMNEAMTSVKSSNVEDKDLFEGSSAKLYYSSNKQFPLRSQAGQVVESGRGNPKEHSAEGSGLQGAPHLNLGKRPMSVRTRRSVGR